MPLCIEERDESEVLTGVGPGHVPLGHCLQGCCGKPARIQVRSRYGGGWAKMCAAFVDGATDPDVYHTQFTSVTTYKAWDAAPNPDVLVRSCEKTLEYNSGAAAIVSWGDGGTVPDCEGLPVEETYSPENCMETLLDDPADYTTVDPVEANYGGDTGTLDDLRSRAIGAFAWGEWSEWTDFVTVDAYTGSYEGGYLNHFLADAGQGMFTAFTNQGATVWQYESEVRVVGEFKIHLAVGEGSAAVVEDLTTVRYTLEPDIPQAFSTEMPSWADEWLPLRKVLRCVCPVQFAPSS